MNNKPPILVQESEGDGGGIIEIVLVLVILLVIGVIAWYVYDSSSSSKSKDDDDESSSPSPSPVPQTVTINGQTFDPNGYMVSKGWWTGRSLSGYSPSSAPTDFSCYNRCDQKTRCVQFSRRQTDGMCALYESTSAQDDLAHVRGVKKKGANSYSDPVALQWYRDTAGSSPVSAQQCADMCTNASSPSCFSWYYRINNQTCVLHRDDPSQTTKYSEGIIDRPIVVNSPSPSPSPGFNNTLIGKTFTSGTSRITFTNANTFNLTLISGSILTFNNLPVSYTIGSTFTEFFQGNFAYRVTYINNNTLEYTSNDPIIRGPIRFTG